MWQKFCWKCNFSKFHKRGECFAAYLLLTMMSEEVPQVSEWRLTSRPEPESERKPRAESPSEPEPELEPDPATTIAKTAASIRLITTTQQKQIKKNKTQKRIKKRNNPDNSSVAILHSDSFGSRRSGRALRVFPAETRLTVYRRCQVIIRVACTNCSGTFIFME